MIKHESGTTVGVVGVGLLGASTLRAVRRHRPGWRTLAFDIDPDALSFARERGWVDETCDTLDGLAPADLVVVCTPTGTIAHTIIALSRILTARTVVTDVASTKSCTVRAVLDRLPQDYPYVPGHPMAGSDRAGPAHSREDMFAGRSCLLSPAPSTPTWATQAASSFWQAIGAEVHIVPIEEHDRLVGLTSHLPHLLIFALVDMVGAELRAAPSHAVYVGQGLLDTTRIGRARASMWTEIFIDNRDHLLHWLACYEKKLGTLRSLLKEQSGVELGKVVSVSESNAHAIPDPRGRESLVREERRKTAAGQGCMGRPGGCETCL